MYDYHLPPSFYLHKLDRDAMCCRNRTVSRSKTPHRNRLHRGAWRREGEASYRAAPKRKSCTGVEHFFQDRSPGENDIQK